jgi:membrane-anchored protein YejM (alkaline phosphatase superfamily)
MLYRDEINRRKFALSWGRKLFFGISWPLSSLLGLLYFKAFIFPQTFSEWIYVAFTFIGHFGFFNFILFFFIYAPIALLLPTYYITRIWSLLLIIGLNSFLLIDALSLSLYQLHIYSYISQLFIICGLKYLTGVNSGLTVLIVGLVFLSIFIWIRGDVIWRYMQGRFRNPVNNWYIFLIILCVVLSKTIYHYGEIHPRISEIFPLNYNLSREKKDYADNRKFYYPTENLNCQSKSNPNLILIIVKKWNKEELGPDSMPVSFHFKNHALSYNSHLGVSTNADDGIYSLFYSLPVSYRSISQNTKPAFQQEMTKRNYELMNLNSNDQDQVIPGTEKAFINNLHTWSLNRSTYPLKPFFISLYINEESRSADKLIHKFILQLQKDNLLDNTHILMTGAYSDHSNLLIPLIWSTPDRRYQEINHLTSHYDVMPTLMHKLWGCKKTFKAASIGKSLDVPLKSWLLVSGKDEFKILDLDNDSRIQVKNGNITHSGKKSRYELIFSALKLMTKFTKPD